MRCCPKPGSWSVHLRNQLGYRTVPVGIQQAHLEEHVSGRGPDDDVTLPPWDLLAAGLKSGVFTALALVRTDNPEIGESAARRPASSPAMKPLQDLKTSGPLRGLQGTAPAPPCRSAFCIARQTHLRVHPSRCRPGRAAAHAMESVAQRMCARTRASHPTHGQSQPAVERRTLAAQRRGSPAAPGAPE